MATTQSIEVDQADPHVRIREVTIRDDELVSYLETVGHDRRERALVRALKIGASTLALSESAPTPDAGDRDATPGVLDAEGATGDDDVAALFEDDERLTRLLDDRFRDEVPLRKRIDEAFWGATD